MEDELSRFEQYTDEVEPVLEDRAVLMENINEGESHFNELLQLIQSPSGVAYATTESSENAERFFSQMTERCDVMLKQWGDIRRPRKLVEFHSLVQWSLQSNRRSLSDSAKLFQLAKDSGNMDADLPSRLSESMLEAERLFERAINEFERIQKALEETANG